VQQRDPALDVRLRGRPAGRGERDATEPLAVVFVVDLGGERAEQSENQSDAAGNNGPHGGFLGDGHH